MMQAELRQTHPDAFVLPAALYSGVAQAGHGRSRLHHRSLVLSIASFPAGNQRRRDSYIRIDMLPHLVPADFGFQDANARHVTQQR